MQETVCPLCFDTLEALEVAPCHDCGGDPMALEHLRAGKHTYAEYEVFPGLPLVLCNFCQVDLTSYDPAFFGLPLRARFGLGHMKFVRDIHPTQTDWDKYCATCNCRLRFLRFVVAARRMHGAGGT